MDGFLTMTIPVVNDQSVRQLLAGLKVSKTTPTGCKIAITKEQIVLPSEIDESFFESIKEGGGLIEIPLL